jgi:hypothetical protein
MMPLEKIFRNLCLVFGNSMCDDIKQVVCQVFLISLIQLAFSLEMLLLQLSIRNRFPSVEEELTVVLLTSYLVTAAALQCIWSVAMAILDVYAILVGRAFRTPRVVSILSVGDWVSHVFSPRAFLVPRKIIHLLTLTMFSADHRRTNLQCCIRIGRHHRSHQR